MGKALVAYFSATSTTRNLAEKLAKVANADLQEITPAQPYTSADLNWNDRSSRSTVEMNDKSSRPEIAGKAPDLSAYDTVFIGFPIWWYVAPTIINTFLESADFSGKRIVLFATSGGSGMGRTRAGLEPSAPGAVFAGERCFGGGASEGELRKWVDSLGL